MKPATIILWSVGISLILVGAFVASLFIHAREVHTYTNGSPKVNSIISTNVWGRPLYMNRYTILSRADERVLLEHGPMNGDQPHGQWTRTYMTGRKTDRTEIVWYLKGREVTREEWERR